MKIKKGIIAALILILVVSGGLLTSLFLSHQLKSTDLSEGNSSTANQAVQVEPAAENGTALLTDQDGSGKAIPERGTGLL